jgi:hypothetical protein
MKFLLFLILLIVIVVGASYLGLNSVENMRPAPPEIKVIVTPTTVTISGPVILRAIRNQATLETVTMAMANDQDISKSWGLQGACRENLTYLGYFNVTAGIDLQDIPDQNLSMEGSGAPAQTTLTLTLPPAKITHVELDTLRSRVVTSNTSILPQLCGSKLPEMVTEVQNNLRKSAEAAAKQQNILGLAEDRASFELKKILLQLGFSKVNVVFSEAGNDQ